MSSVGIQSVLESERNIKERGIIDFRISLLCYGFDDSIDDPAGFALSSDGPVLFANSTGGVGRSIWYWPPGGDDGLE
jgi:hypothetical protein